MTDHHSRKPGPFRTIKGKMQPIYQLWCNIKNRCLNPNYKFRHRYSARGISICPEWIDYEVFYNWATKNGWQRGLTIDRIDNDKGYSPGNCQFITNLKNCVKREITERLRKAASKNVRGNQYTAKPVRCVETGQEFNSAKKASIFIGLADDAVSKAIGRGTRAGGHYWKHIIKGEDKLWKKNQL